MFDWRKLEIFIRVFETKSFSKSAKELYLSQPAVTIHIKELENLLGVRLLDRDTRKVIATKAGKIVYTYGKKILQLYNQMEQELLPFKDPESGVIILGGSTIPGQYILPKILKIFKEKYPKVNIFLKVSDTQGIIEDLFEGEIELGLVGAKPKPKEISGEIFCKDEIVLIGPPFFEKEEIELLELYDLPLIKREEGSGTWRNVKEVLERKNVDLYKLKIVGEMGSTEAVKRGVIEGLGFSFVSKRAVQFELSLNLLKIVKIKELKILRNFYLVYYREKRFSPLVQNFLNFLKNFSS